jgi:flagellar biosynthesis protein FlhG
VSQFLHGSLDYLGMIPQDPALEQAVRQQKTVSMLDQNAKSSRAFEVIAGNLLNGTHNQVQVKWGISQMFSNFLARR